MTDGSFSVVLGHGGLLWVIMSVADSVGPFVYQDSGNRRTSVGILRFLLVLSFSDLLSVETLV